MQLGVPQRGQSRVRDLLRLDVARNVTRDVKAESNQGGVSKDETDGNKVSIIN